MTYQLKEAIEMYETSMQMLSEVKNLLNYVIVDGSIIDAGDEFSKHERFFYLKREGDFWVAYSRADNKELAKSTLLYDLLFNVCTKFSTTVFNASVIGNIKD